MHVLRNPGSITLGESNNLLGLEERMGVPSPREGKANEDCENRDQPIFGDFRKRCSGCDPNQSTDKKMKEQPAIDQTPIPWSASRSSKEPDPKRAQPFTHDAGYSRTNS